MQAGLAYGTQVKTRVRFQITQKWIHKLDLIRREKDATMEKWVGRTRSDSIELSRKPISSHVARMVGGKCNAELRNVEHVVEGVLLQATTGSARSRSRSCANRCRSGR